MRVEHGHFGWTQPGPTCAHGYLLPTILRLITNLSRGRLLTVVDLGCGNGYVTARLAKLGHKVIGIDVSSDGIEIARQAYPNIDFRVASVYDENLLAEFTGVVDCVVALEVIEHLFYPRKLLEQSYRLLRPGGAIIVSTPYHGYLKNLAIALVNGWDRHFEVERDGGHIKFFSKRTLSRLALEAGFRNLRCYGVGRLRGLWKSMILVGEKPWNP